MKYPIAIECDNKKHTCGVVVPDLPGCFSAGTTPEAAYENAKESIARWIDAELDAEHEIPPASRLEDLIKQKKFKGWVFALVDIPDSLLADKAVRINITLPGRVLRRLDFLAKKSGETRSGYIARLVLQQKWNPVAD